MRLLNSLFEWRTYVRYLLLTAAVFFIHYLSDIWGIEALVINGGFFAWSVLFLFYALGIFVADIIINFLFVFMLK